MTHFTLGFIFNSDLSQVLLIHKDRPVWQKGQLNGLGGKIEAGEDPVTCIVREVAEEACLTTQPDEWLTIGSMQGPNFLVTVLTMKYSGKASDAQAGESQPVEWCLTAALPTNVIWNLRWWIPLCQDVFYDHQIEHIAVTYNQDF